MNLFTPPVETMREKSATDTPQVSVVVTLSDCEPYLEACLDSIRAQTQPDFELVIVDDCSTDGGLGVAESWLARNEEALAGYRLLRHTKNMGLAYSRNTGFAGTSAPYVFVMDAGNALYPPAVARCLSAIKSSGAGAAYTQLEFFGENIGLGLADFWSVERLKRANYIDAMALVDKRAWEKVGGYTQLTAAGWEDYDFWCKFAEHELSAVFVPEVLCRYRCHSSALPMTQAEPNAGALILEMSMRHPWLEL